tara:strand:+ start:1138 stop:1821 length:684 start_codon:yes stop_codon:yes gene_type:complete
MAWDWLNKIGGAVDWTTSGLTDFDGKGAGGSTWWGGKQTNPIFGGADKTWGSGPSKPSFGFENALDAFTTGYAGQSSVTGSSPTSRGSSFLADYRPQESSAPSGASMNMQEGGGFSGTLGNNIAFSQPGAIFLKNYPEPDVNNYYGGGGSAGGSAGGSKGGSKLGSAIGGAAAGFAKGGVPGAIIGGIGGLFCDERVKVDIAPLETTEVNDDLAQVAFFIKGLRERS